MTGSKEMTLAVTVLPDSQAGWMSICTIDDTYQHDPDMMTH